MDARPKASQEALLAGVPDGIAGWKGALDEIEPDRCTPSTEILNGQVIGPAALEPKKLLMGGARRPRDDSQAQAGSDSGGTQIAAEVLEGLAGSASPAIRRSLPRAPFRS